LVQPAHAVHYGRVGHDQRLAVVGIAIALIKLDVELAVSQIPRMTLSEVLLEDHRVTQKLVESSQPTGEGALFASHIPIIEVRHNVLGLYSIRKVLTLLEIFYLVLPCALGIGLDLVLAILLLVAVERVRVILFLGQQIDDHAAALLQELLLVIEERSGLCHHVLRLLLEGVPPNFPVVVDHVVGQEYAIVCRSLIHQEALQRDVNAEYQ